MYFHSWKQNKDKISHVRHPWEDAQCFNSGNTISPTRLQPRNTADILSTILQHTKIRKQSPMLECVNPPHHHPPTSLLEQISAKHPFFWEMSCCRTDSQMSYRCTRMDEPLLVIAHAAGYGWGYGGLFVRKYGWLNRSAWSVFVEPATLFRQGQAHTWRLEFYQRHIYHDFTSAPQWQIGQEFLWSPSCSEDETFFFSTLK